MKKGWGLFILSFFGILMLFYFRIFEITNKTPFLSQKLNELGDPYFIKIPITKWTENQIPCLSIEIGENLISSQLDLGYMGYFSISSELLEKLNDKIYLRSVKTCGILGKEYEEKIYEFPEIQIEQLSFQKYTVQEEPKEFHHHGSFVKNGGAPSPNEPGRIGWKIFQNTNLLLDLGNNLVAFCDSIDTLNNHQYEVKSFVQTPLLSNRGFVELEAKTPDGLLRCVLDTGCTWNVLNTEVQGGQNLNELIWTPENHSKIPQFVIGDIDFGPIFFRHIPIKLPIHVEAILGIDFLKKNLVYLDFVHDLIYFTPSSHKENIPTVSLEVQLDKNQKSKL